MPSVSSGGADMPQHADVLLSADESNRLQRLDVTPGTCGFFDFKLRKAKQGLNADTVCYALFQGYRFKLIRMTLLVFSVQIF